jgi:alcohol dehydrogenase class IV
MPVPTTAGTGSETTGTAILDITSMNFKTGIASRLMKPTLGIVDALNTDSCPRAVHISAGLDVLGHSFESFTAIPCGMLFIHHSYPLTNYLVTTSAPDHQTRFFARLTKVVTL